MASLCALISLLIEKGALNQGDVIARYEALSQQMMMQAGAEYTVPVIDIIRNHVAGEHKRVPS